MTKWGGGITNGKVLVFGGIEVQLPISGPVGVELEGAWEKIMAISGGDEVDVICIEEAAC